MAFNEILVGRLNRWLQKLLVIKNTALRTLSPDLQAVIMMQSGVEERYLQGWNRFAQEFVMSTPGVGNNAGFRIRNPVGSGLLVVIEYVGIDPSAGSDYRMQVGAATTDLATSSSSTGRMDPRGNPNSAAIASITSNASTTPTLTGATVRIGVTANFAQFNFPFTVNQELPVLPGDAFQVQNQTSNVAFSGSAIWRERLLESSELS